MKIVILIDDSTSWFVPYGKRLMEQLIKNGHQVNLIHKTEEGLKGDICFLLSCSKLVKKAFLEQFEHCIVVHGSDLPYGKGFSPLQWQILQGKDEIVLTLFEVVEAVDAGPYYMKSPVHFRGDELLDELREKMAEEIINMCLLYSEQCRFLKPISQYGEESYFRKLTKEDHKLDINASLKEQFNHLRIADNDKFPLWFEYKGKKYILKVYKDVEK